VARILIVGCGCRGRSLAAALVADGHRVRGTTRSRDRLAAIEAAGAEAVVADPDRLGTLMPLLEGVSAVCWLMGSASGETGSLAALHGPRLVSMLAKLVDTSVRGLVYEARGTVSAGFLTQGAGIVRGAGASYRMPVQVVDAEPGDMAVWLTTMRLAVKAILIA